MIKKTTIFSLVIGALFFLFSCQNGSPCRQITGTWSDRDGHNFVFQSNGKALWLNKFGQLIDTVTCVFVLNCQAKPATLDFKDFDNGPFVGKTMYGILEWSGDSLFRYCYGLGTSPDYRPKQFDPALTMKFYR